MAHDIRMPPPSNHDCTKYNLTRMRWRPRIPVNLRYALTVIGLLLVLNFILRLVFLMYNLGQAATVPPGEILLSFLVGIRFDLATIFIFNGLILLFMALPGAINQRARTYLIGNALIVLVNFPVLAVNGIDVVYYGFSEKRLTHELFTTKSDLSSFRPEMLMEWWYLFVLSGGLLYVLYRVLGRFAKHHLEQRKAQPVRSRRQHFLALGAFALVMFAGVRSGLQNQPLWYGQAFLGETVFGGNLGLNSGYTVVSSLDLWQSEPVQLVDPPRGRAIAQAMVRNTFDGPFVSPEYPFLRKASFPEPERRHNVVVLIIESLNAEKMGAINGAPPAQSLTPFLDSLSAIGRLYTRFYANGTRSVESIPALLNSMPEVFFRPTIGSRYAENTHYGLGQMLRDRGYRTAFFCGAHNGSMGFDQYAEISGFADYYGMDEYPHAERDFDGYWGCYDGPVLEWMADTQDQFQEPFLSVFFSISNHHPFRLPPRGNADIARLPLPPMDKTIRYTDRVLEQYFAQVREYDWFEETIFVITGDHCFHADEQRDRPVMENFHVPLLLIGPGITPGRDDRTASHVSVLPTLIELLRLDTWHSSAAISLLDSTRNPFVMNNLMGISTLARGERAYSTNFEQTRIGYTYGSGKWARLPRGKVVRRGEWKEMDIKLRSLYQELHNARVRNRFHARPGRVMSMSQ